MDNFVYSWIGVEVGYVHSAFDNAVCKVQCNNGSSYTPDDFILVIETIRKLASALIIITCTCMRIIIVLTASHYSSGCSRREIW